MTSLLIGDAGLGITELIMHHLTVLTFSTLDCSRTSPPSRKRRVPCEVDHAAPFSYACAPSLPPSLPCPSTR